MSLCSFTTGCACLAGPSICNKSLVELLASYWSQDALVQVLLHALRLALAERGLQRPWQQPEGEAGSLQEVQELQEQADCKRSVGLLELHEVLQRAAKVRSWTYFGTKSTAAN
jgi:hypothetical protein